MGYTENGPFVSFLNIWSSDTSLRSTSIRNTSVFIEMASATGRVDELVKDYLIYRGLTTTYRTFEAELKNEKEKGLRVSFLLILHVHSVIFQPNYVWNELPNHYWH